MALDKLRLDPTGSGSKGAGAIGVYAGVDTLAAMRAAGYFNGAFSELAQTKLILLVASDGTALHTVTRSGTTTVTLGAASGVIANGVAVAGAVTLSSTLGKITTEALTTAAGALYTLTVTDDQVAAADIIMVSIANGTNTQGIPILSRVTPAAGSFVVTIENNNIAAQALNGTLVVSFEVRKV